MKALKGLALDKEMCYMLVNTPATPLPSGMRNPGRFFDCYENPWNNQVKGLRVSLDIFPLSFYTFFSKPAGPLPQGMLSYGGSFLGESA